MVVRTGGFIAGRRKRLRGLGLSVEEVLQGHGFSVCRGEAYPIVGKAVRHARNHEHSNAEVVREALLVPLATLVTAPQDVRLLTERRSGLRAAGKGATFIGPKLRTSKLDRFGASRQSREQAERGEHNPDWALNLSLHQRATKRHIAPRRYCRRCPPHHNTPSTIRSCTHRRDHKVDRPGGIPPSRSSWWSWCRPRPPYRCRCASWGPPCPSAWWGRSSSPSSPHAISAMVHQAKSIRLLHIEKSI